MYKQVCHVATVKMNKCLIKIEIESLVTLILSNSAFYGEDHVSVATARVTRHSHLLDNKGFFMPVIHETYFVLSLVTAE